jgi:hypothetical protein
MASDIEADRGFLFAVIMPNGSMELAMKSCQCSPLFPHASPSFANVCDRRGWPMMKDSIQNGFEWNSDVHLIFRATVGLQ